MLNVINDEVVQQDLDFVLDSNVDFTKMKDSTILITGATGLIGVSLVRSLIWANVKKNCDIKILVLVRDIEKAKKIYCSMLERNDLHIIKGDILDKINIDERIDYIIHCASVTSSKTMIEKPVETIMTSVDGTKNILELAKEKKCKSVVYVSSMEMYGTIKDEYEVTENDLGYINPLKLRSNYPESKRLCENLCIAYLSQHSIPVKIARLSQTFGAGILEGENRVFAQFAKCVINNQNIALHTKGNSEGNYCYTSDTVAGLLTILLDGENGEAYNVVNPESHTSIINMAHLVCDKIANGRIMVEFEIPENNQYGYAEDTKLKLNSDKLSKLGWKPQIGLEDSYKRLIKSMKNTLELKG
ncbi:NAD-dependent epimerase/dehydratase family protein [Terrisporobacter hibernicus]|uniref:NAD-dependent epimerase/dehydratase family protein n=1 Tax=Terrisporobacter hibernicus TaxID=2813371 RepID=A0AAX2ZIT9_9FIRM|nr:NAD-dependent epimerase/dehydratase family protein [Terrisporobacter hibernicus]UEL48685.1 NAD-dependent epimerase/dehydratase family protein [Terrisporobacter hibernicus]